MCIGKTISVLSVLALACCVQVPAAAQQHPVIRLTARPIHVANAARDGSDRDRTTRRQVKSVLEKAKMGPTAPESVLQRPPLPRNPENGVGHSSVKRTKSAGGHQRANRAGTMNATLQSIFAAHGTQEEETAQEPDPIVNLTMQDDDLDQDLDEPDLDDGDTRESETGQARSGDFQWPERGIREIALDVRDHESRVPDDRSQMLRRESHTDWHAFYPREKTFAWTPPNIRYKPLYFENVPLERYGQCHRCQGLNSTIHFSKAFLTLPYHLYVDPPHRCDYPLGYCRPGNAVPQTKQSERYGRTR